MACCCSCVLRILVWEFAALQFHDATKVASIGLDLVGIPHREGLVGCHLSCSFCVQCWWWALARDLEVMYIQSSLRNFSKCFFNPCHAHDFKRELSQEHPGAILAPANLAIKSSRATVGNFCKFIRKRNFTGKKMRGLSDLRGNYTKVPSEQRALLTRQNYTLRPLNSVGALSVLKVIDVSWQPIAVFVATLLAQTLVHSNFLSILVLFIFLVFPVMEFIVLLIGIVAAIIWRGVRWKAVTFWTWWPFWKLVLCASAAMVAFTFGDFLWNTAFLPSQLIQRMQVYQNINPLNANVTGVRLQDAGAITFDRNAGVDRMMTGCLVDTTTFCVAAITSLTEKDGHLLPSQLTSYDLFMTGTDCCECPGEFRCGDWNQPGAQLGGLRETDPRKEKFYKLATGDFSATFKKTVKYPIFLQWHNEPQEALHSLKSTANSNRALALTATPFLIVVVVVILNGLLQLLMFLQIAGPHKPPTGDGMLGRMGQRLLPSMYGFQREEQEVVGPASATYVQFWHGAT